MKMSMDDLTNLVFETALELVPLWRFSLERRYSFCCI
jgi:hypothetical protein